MIQNKISHFYPTPLYSFLRYANENPSIKRVLDCGAGGQDPKLALFYENGFDTYGIDISEERIGEFEKACNNRRITIDIKKADMRKIPFDDNFFGFVYSYNSIFHLTKEDIRKTIDEIYRVMVPGGLCYLNFLSVNARSYSEGEKIRPGEVVKSFDDEEHLHSYFEDDEPDGYFKKFEIIYKEKKYILKGRYNNTGCTCLFEYIVKKNG
jgi:ubiquinone/menaquinone biosynthesis C-methylase UbiE